MNQQIDKLNEVLLVYTRPPITQTPKVESSQEASELFRLYYPKGSIDYKEFFFVMYLNQSNNVLAVSKVSEGGITGTVVDIRIILQQALLLHATSTIVCHNHPSGNLSPSECDRRLTKKLVEAGRTMDISVIDHIILTSESYYSFADNGIL